MTAYGVLSRGLIGGHFSVDRELAPGDFRSRAPRFEGANRMARGEEIVALIGARTRERLARRWAL